jgi:hypothetical protein
MKKAIKHAKKKISEAKQIVKLATSHKVSGLVAHKAIVKARKAIKKANSATVKHHAAKAEHQNKKRKAAHKAVKNALA